MQTSYSIEHVAGYVGGLADSDLAHKIIPMRNNSGADLPHGKCVVHDTGTGTSALSAKVLADTTAKIMGVSVYSAAKAGGPLDASGANGVRDDDMFNVISQGQVYVTCEDAQTPSSGVYARFGPGTAIDADALGLYGQFRTDADIHTAWVKKTAYTVGQRRALSGKVYRCITQGTSEDSDTPALIGSTSADATDGTAHWAYIGICDSSTRASAREVTGRWLSKVGAGELATLDLNIP